MDWPALIDDLRGRPFQWGARGPEAFDCFGLAAEVARRLGVSLPDYGADVLAGDLGAIADRTRGAIGSGRWVRHDDPQPGDMVALSMRREIHHFGVWTPYGVLHTLAKTGALLTPLSMLRRLGYQRIEFWRWAP